MLWISSDHDTRFYQRTVSEPIQDGLVATKFLNALVGLRTHPVCAEAPSRMLKGPRGKKLRACHVRHVTDRRGDTRSGGASLAERDDDASRCAL
jgi:hypothetical protein